MSSKGSYGDLNRWGAGGKGVVELQELPGVTKAGAFCGKNAFPWFVLSLSVCWTAFLSARAKRMETPHLPPVCYILNFFNLASAFAASLGYSQGFQSHHLPSWQFPGSG